jgi:uncharacterized protein
MKRTFICLLAAFALVSASASAAQPGATEISASGTGSVSLPPDIATISAAIETNSENANDSIAQNNAIYDRVVAALTKLGIRRDDIALGYYSIRYNPRPSAMPANPPEERYGYTVLRNFLVKVRQIGTAGTVSDACIASGATSINAIDFGLADPDAARTTAIAKAVGQARSNAQALARAAGLHIVSIKSIEFGSGAVPAPMGATIARVNAAPTQFDQSNVSVTVLVDAVFLAEP